MLSAFEKCNPGHDIIYYIFKKELNIRLLNKWLNFQGSPMGTAGCSIWGRGERNQATYLGVYQQTQDPNYKPPTSANLDHGSQPPSSYLEPVLKFLKGRVDFSMGFGLDP